MLHSNENIVLLHAITWGNHTNIKSHSQSSIYYVFPDKTNMLFYKVASQCMVQRPLRNSDLHEVFRKSIRSKPFSYNIKTLCVCVPIPLSSSHKCTA